MVTNLTSDRDHTPLVIEKQHVAVASHQLEDQGPLDLRPRSGRHLKFDNALESLLLDAHKGHLPQPMLKLLRQGAAGPAFAGGWICIRRGQSACQLSSSQTMPRQGSEAELQGGGSGCWAFSKRLGTRGCSSRRPDLQGGQINLLQG